MMTSPARGILVLVFVLHAASCQNQDTNDVMLASDFDDNNPSTDELITELENVTSGNDTESYCQSFWSEDPNIGENLTWPEAYAGSTVGVVLQDSICGAQVFRDCMEGGQWSEIHTIDPSECLADTVFKILVFIGFGVSLVACVTAFAIFTMTRSSLRGLTHYQYHIHWNLITSFILYPVVLLIVIGLKTTNVQPPLWLWNLLTVLLGYFVLANFFWMLVEGLVLFVLVATAFPGSQRGRAFVKWCLIGWGIPAVLMTAWIIAERALTPEGSDFILQINKADAANYGCLTGPVFLALVINGLVLIVVMRILWQKLRDDARNTTRYSRERSSWRAAKSTFVILILLGVYYALPILVFSFDPPFLVKYVISKIGNIVNSFQGLAVCTLYVFCNAEVRRALRNCHRRFRNRTNLTFSTRLSSPSMSRSATPRHSKSHSSSEGSATKRPSTSGAEVEAAEMAVLAEEMTPQPRRQTYLVMEPLLEEPSECGRGDSGPADV
ncbi:corticotropin-releasing factor receptor 2-like isoform X2 [Patiria miniata]|uniref:Uncharacterized protein n=1 Tax=Patiria miniata TaxID=46514 RepID=A0A914B5V1_PATMI|nr:corticotropin-releasing factor receptor 2-like isoform X2 [Patiria miniata]